MDPAIDQCTTTSVGGASGCLVQADYAVTQRFPASVR